ncbi:MULTISPECIES: alpha,alpha-trehalose-phosphate synthase (UDP-forming) [unclassified Aureimonas]|uniref:alpha,alpha-trehalose-phosphate synthase (UDP-forming) n=1 Tax=unclassified Aureimonas TaxID=2615206 RepID=UPI0006F3229B|nr:MULTISPECIES: trehalose-6-phosphate synthase [unclassified Aureimonas]KQT60732.1 alpha,alpha-trehalose-phosphate synthase [Aureimonas sp. Leaf460]KQT68861.1 alpha,alpha-trehalose-phosphate synthase [Aureimonas sp. Leaf427]
MSEPRLVVVSNRVGPLDDEGKAGGLAVGLADALRRRGGLWFGWSGETDEAAADGPVKTERHGQTELATIDLTPEENEGFYLGYANRSLWPLLHYRLDLVQFDRSFDRVYHAVNRRFAERLAPLLRPDDLVWVHDYHFFPLGAELRKAGFAGRIGYFLHIPFCPPEIFTALPASHDLVRAMLAYDLVGFQTETDRMNFLAFCTRELGGEVLEGNRVRVGDRTIEVDSFPIGIDAEGYRRFAVSPEAGEHEEMLRDIAKGRPLVVGVDRLDYTKGIVERLLGFERLLEDHEEMRGGVNLLQIAPLSRAELETYAGLRTELEATAGRVNGRFATLDWTPIQIMTTGFTRRALAGIYRAARVCFVTPLRDGMNLVAKEYVAAQDPTDPGVLLLSRFAGARAELEGGALLVNPYNPDTMADALKRALTMKLDERIERFEAMRETVFAGTASRWCDRFLGALADVPAPSQPASEEPPVQAS